MHDVEIIRTTLSLYHRGHCGTLTMSPIRTASRIVAGRFLHLPALLWKYLSYRKLIWPRLYSLPIAAGIQRLMDIGVKLFGPSS